MVNLPFAKTVICHYRFLSFFIPLWSYKNYYIVALYQKGYPGFLCLE